MAPSGEQRGIAFEAVNTLCNVTNGYGHIRKGIVRRYCLAVHTKSQIQHEVRKYVPTVHPKGELLAMKTLKWGIHVSSKATLA